MGGALDDASQSARCAGVVELLARGLRQRLRIKDDLPRRDELRRALTAVQRSAGLNVNSILLRRFADRPSRRMKEGRANDRRQCGRRNDNREQSRLPVRFGHMQSPEAEGVAEMDIDRLEGNWKQFKGKVKEQWGMLTDDDLSQIAGKRDQLEGKIQQRYGLEKDLARREVDNWLSHQK